MVDHFLYLGSDDGIVAIRRRRGGWEDLGAGLKGLEIRAIAHRPDRPGELLAGSYGRGLFHSPDAGRTWQALGNGLAQSHVRSILWDPADSRVAFTGTEPAAIYRSIDGGQTWHDLPSIRTIKGHEQWYLPYSPRAGAVRSLAAVPGQAGTFYAAVEPGGVLYTRDHGDTWTLLNSTLHPDVHQVIVSANGSSIVLAATGGGVFQSLDGGKNWVRFEPDYTRAIVQPMDHPDLIFAGPAARVGHLGRVERSRDGGATWETWSDGLAAPLPGMVEQLVTGPGTLDELGGIFAVLSSGEVCHSEISRADWTPVVCGGSPHVNVLDLGVG